MLRPRINKKKMHLAQDIPVAHLMHVGGNALECAKLSDGEVVNLQTHNKSLLFFINFAGARTSAAMHAWHVPPPGCAS